MALATASRLPLSPTLGEARKLARDYNVIPLRHTFIDDCETPVSAFLKLRGRGPAFLLESAEQGQVGRWSFLGFRPRAVLRWRGGVLSEWRGERALDGGPPDAETDAPDPYAAVDEYLSRFRIAPVEDLPPFAGGAVGFFGYDLVRTVEPLGESNPDTLGLPDMALMVSDVLLAFDHLRHELTILACAFADDEGGIDAAYEHAAAAIADVRKRLRGPVPEELELDPTVGERIQARLDDVLAQWRETAPGEQLVLTWPRVRAAAARRPGS